MKEIVFDAPKQATEWVVYQHKTFAVTVRHWMSGERNNWNVYANVFDNHPLFGKVDILMRLHFHGGSTLDNLITIAPARGIQYDWQKETQTYKIGSDYQHYMDYYEDTGTEQGIPPSIHWDAKELAKELYEAAEEAVSTEQPA